MTEVKQNKICGTTHYPHGWLGITSNFTGTAPTIDSGIWKHHTLLVQIERIDKSEYKNTLRS